MYGEATQTSGIAGYFKAPVTALQVSGTIVTNSAVIYSGNFTRGACTTGNTTIGMSGGQLISALCV